MTTGTTIVSQERLPLALSGEANRFATAWREHLDVFLDELVVEVNSMPAGTQQQLAAHYLGRARDAVHRRVSWAAAIVGAWTGVDVERAWLSTHAAEVAILRATDLAKADQLEAKYAASDELHVRLRSFRNLLIGTMVALILLALLIGFVALAAPHAFAVCDAAATRAASSCPTGRSGPSGADVFLVEVLGLAGASITAATAIRKLSGTSTPYAVPLMSLLLKLPTGAVTAVLGILLVRAGFGPTITTLNQGQVIGYAVLFGAAQQLFLQFVDKRAQRLLGAVTTAK